MSLPYLFVKRGLGHLIPSFRDEYPRQVRRQERSLLEQEQAPCPLSPAGRLGSWLVRATLALFLLPALLVVLLVGAAGILVLDIARLCDRWTGPTAE